MKKSISINKKIGRPKKKGGVHPVSAVRLPPEVAASVDAASDFGSRLRKVFRTTAMITKMTLANCLKFVAWVISASKGKGNPQHFRRGFQL